MLFAGRLGSRLISTLELIGGHTSRSPSPTSDDLSPAPSHGSTSPDAHDHRDGGRSASVSSHESGAVAPPLPVHHRRSTSSFGLDGTVAAAGFLASCIMAGAQHLAEGASLIGATIRDSSTASSGGSSNSNSGGGVVDGAAAIGGGSGGSIKNANAADSVRRRRAAAALRYLSESGAATGASCERVAEFMLGRVGPGGFIPKDAIFCTTADTVLEVAVSAAGCCVAAAAPTGVSGDCVGVATTEGGTRLVLCGAVEAVLVDPSAHFAEGRGERRHPTAPLPLLSLGGAHANTVLCVAASPDGFIATGGCDGAVVLWSTENSRPLAVFRDAHADWVRFLAFSSSNKPSGGGGSPGATTHLTSAADDGVVALWDIRRAGGAAAPVPIARATLDEGRRVHALARRFDGVVTAVACEESVTLLGAGLERIANFSPHNGGVTALALTPLDALLVSGGEDEAVILSRLVPAGGGRGAPVPIARCTSLVTQRRCMAFMTCVSSIVVLQAPPQSAVLVVGVAASDGSFVVWTVELSKGDGASEADVICATTRSARKVEFCLGSLTAACAATAAVACDTP